MRLKRAEGERVEEDGTDNIEELEEMRLILGLLSLVASFPG